MDILKSKQPSAKQKSFELLPEAIRSWLISEEVVDTIEEINLENGFVGPKLPILARNITRLVLNLTAPENFLASLQKDLGLSPNKANEIAQVVKDEILQPIAEGLKNTEGIDVTKIQTKPSQSERPEMDFEGLGQVKKPTPQIPKPQTREPAQSLNQAKPPKTQPAAQQTKPAPKPFILHQETPKPETVPTTKEQSEFKFELPTSEKPAPKPQTKAGFGSFFSSSVTKKKEPGNNQKVESKHEKAKVVHYSAFRTVLGEKEPGKILNKKPERKA